MQLLSLQFIARVTGIFHRPVIFNLGKFINVRLMLGSPQHRADAIVEFQSAGL